MPSVKITPEARAKARAAAKAAILKALKLNGIDKVSKSELNRAITRLYHKDMSYIEAAMKELS